MWLAPWRSKNASASEPAEVAADVYLGALSPSDRGDDLRQMVRADAVEASGDMRFCGDFWLPRGFAEYRGSTICRLSVRCGFLTALPGGLGFALLPCRVTRNSALFSGANSNQSVLSLVPAQATTCVKAPVNVAAIRGFA